MSKKHEGEAGNVRSARGATSHKAKRPKARSQTASLIVGVGASVGAFTTFFSNIQPAGLTSAGSGASAKYISSRKRLTYLKWNDRLIGGVAVSQRIGATRGCFIMNEIRVTPEATDEGDAAMQALSDATNGKWIDESIRFRPYTTLAAAAVLGLALGRTWRR